MHAAAFPVALSRTTLPASLVALVAGAALTAGVIGLADSDQLADPPANVIVVEGPGQGVAAKDEAAVASAIAVGPELRGSKASAIKSSGSTLSDR
jgi:tryptophan synthase beta subunit